MKPLRTLLIALTLFVSAAASAQTTVIDVTKHRVKADGRTLCTDAINRAISRAPEGAVVFFPAGRYLTGTIHLRSGVTLRLDEGAEIIGSPNVDDYDSYIPTKDMSRYDTGAGTRNSNVTTDARWTKALILGVGCDRVSIEGHGTINGQHLEDALGEEGMRGPHTILLAECREVHVSDVSITQASNYAILGYELQRADFTRLHITQGWDGIHIRGGGNISIDDCTIETGDDAIAGGYWDTMRIAGCTLNSSCNGLRIIEPCDDVTVTGCNIYGPGRYPHRTRLPHPIAEPLPAGHDLIYGVVIEPGAWGRAPGDVGKVTIADTNIDNTWAPIAYSMGDDNNCHTLYIQNVKGTNIRGVAQPVNRQDCVKSWDVMKLDNVEVSSSSLKN